MAQKLHRHIVESTIQALAEIFGPEPRYADKVIEKYLKSNRRWGARDRRFFAETVYGCVRWWRKYWTIIGEEPIIEPHALWQVWGVHHALVHGDLPQWPEFENYTFADIRKRAQGTPMTRAQAESVPDWLDQFGEQELGARWSTILHSLNEKAPVDLRVNTLKSSRDKVRARLQTEEVETDFIDGVPTGLTLQERRNVFVTTAFKEGLFEVQDRASQLVAPLLQVEPGHRVIDACAGAGGKSLHIAALLQNKGKLIALDIHEWKLKELRTRASRAGVDVIETRLIESAKVIKRLESTADRLLLDVPCSGLGVLRRNPDSKWKLSMEEIKRLQALQVELLSSYCKMLKPGGIMVYATCSILPSENERQVENFLAAHPGEWILQEQLRVDPDQGRGDGFFAARFKREKG
jgi:16S rRNA (cytosine967-C5)-methyltransferase